MTKSLITAVLVLTATSLAEARENKCQGVDRSLTKLQAHLLSVRVSSQFSDPKSEAVQAFRYRDWTIVYVEFNSSDPGFVFYRGDPLREHYVTAWGGAASYSEEKEIHLYIERHARGIPEKLARCFAWHVTNDRDM